MDNKYPPKIPFMLPSMWILLVMTFLYILISLMLGFDPIDWHGPTQILFVLLELIGAIIFVVSKMFLDADYIKELNN